MKDAKKFNKEPDLVASRVSTPPCVLVHHHIGVHSTLSSWCLTVHCVHHHIGVHSSLSSWCLTVHYAIWIAMHFPFALSTVRCGFSKCTVLKLMMTLLKLMMTLLKLLMTVLKLLMTEWTEFTDFCILTADYCTETSATVSKLLITVLQLLMYGILGEMQGWIWIAVYHWCWLHCHHDVNMCIVVQWLYTIAWNVHIWNFPFSTVSIECCALCCKHVNKYDVLPVHQSLGVHSSIQLVYLVFTALLYTLVMKFTHCMLSILHLHCEHFTLCWKYAVYWHSTNHKKTFKI